MLTVLFDMRVLLDACQSEVGRTGVYSVAHNVFDGLMRREDLRIIPYCSSNYAPVLRERYRELTGSDGSPEFMTDASDLSSVDAFLSPFHPIPEVVHNCPWIARYTIVYDLLPLLYPKWFRGNEQTGFLDMLRTLTADDQCFAISQYTKDDFKKHIPWVDQSKITVTPLAASSSFHPCLDDAISEHRVRTKYGIPEGKRYMLSLCSLEPRKNLIMALRAFVSFLQKSGADDLIFVLAGTAWSSFDELLQQEFPDYPKYNCVIVRTGYVDDDDLAVLYSSADFFIYTSVYEGFGLPPLESMSCGTPVITSNTTSLPEIVGDAAYTVDPDSFDEHVQAISELYKNGELKRRLAALGLKQARRFSWESCVSIMAEQMLETHRCLSPKVSVVTITRNLLESGRQRTVRQALESVHLQQYDGEIEHVVIDGASTDGTLEMLEQYVRKKYITVYSEADTGIYDAMNKGIDHASGKYLVFLNSDDFFISPHAVSQAVHALELSHADFTCAGCYYIRNDAIIGVLRETLQSFYLRMPLSHQAMFTRLDLLREYRFDDRYRSSGDYDLVLRLILGGAKAIKLSILFTAYRWEGMSKTHEQLGCDECIQALMRQYTSFFPLFLQECTRMFYEHTFPVKLLIKILGMVDASVAEPMRQAFQTFPVQNGYVHFVTMPEIEPFATPVPVQLLLADDTADVIASKLFIDLSEACIRAPKKNVPRTQQERFVGNSYIEKLLFKARLVKARLSPYKAKILNLKKALFQKR